MYSSFCRNSSSSSSSSSILFIYFLIIVTIIEAKEATRSISNSINQRENTGAGASMSSANSSSSSTSSHTSYYHHDNPFLIISKNDTSSSDACNIHTNCTSCTSSSVFCHWCSFDSKCHTKGSIHGCTWGQTCPQIPDSNNNNNSKTNKCASHTSCTECTLSSHLCHWCAFDNACHVIGSMYGCTRGVDCFNNDRCKRSLPEKIDYRNDSSGDSDGNGTRTTWEEIGMVPIFIIVFLGLSTICCCSICFMGVKVVKGAYDDWTMVYYRPSPRPRQHDDDDDDDDDDHYYDDHEYSYSYEYNALNYHDSNHDDNYDHHDDDERNHHQNVFIEDEQATSLDSTPTSGTASWRNEMMKKNQRSKDRRKQRNRRARRNGDSGGVLPHMEEGDEGNGNGNGNSNSNITYNTRQHESHYSDSRNNISNTNQQGNKVTPATMPSESVQYLPRHEMHTTSSHTTTETIQAIDRNDIDEESGDPIVGRNNKNDNLNDDDNHMMLTQKLLPNTTNNNQEDGYQDDPIITNNIGSKEEAQKMVSTPTSSDTAHPSPGRLPQFNNIPLNLTSMRSRFSSSSLSRRRRTTNNNNQPTSSNSLKFCYYSCLTIYIISIITTIIVVTGSIYYFPKVPQFNVCSDEFAWNSIIDSLTSLKVEASFEVLSSVKNTNHLDIVLDGVSGSFRHANEDIGTFSMKSTTIKADSITDVLVTCSVRPDRWEALGLISDYYRNKLMFVINVSGNVKVKGMIGYSLPISMKDILINVNDSQMDDRHLCHCPQWKDLYPTVSPVQQEQLMIGGGPVARKSLLFEDAMVMKLD